MRHTVVALAMMASACVEREEIGELNDDGVVTPLSLERFTTPIYASWAANCAITSSGGVACWGNNDAGELGAEDDIPFSQSPVTPVGLASGALAVFGGDASHCVMRDTGRIECWGHVFLGVLDDIPIYAYALEPWPLPNVGDDAVQIVFGWQVYCLLTREGQPKCWGSGNSGQLGNGSTVDTVEPHDIADVAGERYVELTIGDRHSCGVTSKGGVMCWGRNDRGQLGTFGADQLLPTPVGIENVLHIAAGRVHTCALETDGSVWCWGDAVWGQLGGAPAPSVARVAGLPNAKAIAARNNQTCAIASDGAVWCWGELQFDAMPTPPVQMLEASFGATAIACGSSHACAMNDARIVRCWGNNDVGQTGGGELAL